MPACENAATGNSIEARGLSVAYKKRAIIEGLALDVPRGKVTSIIGPNGCGKSTLLKSLGRILQPRTGTVVLEGKDIAHMPTAEVARTLAVLPQSPQAPAGLTVGELVAHGRYPHRKRFGLAHGDDRAVVQWALEATRLVDLEHRAVDELSGGQRQRTWIAMALAQQTGVILLDEPTTYLDLAYQLEVLELLQQLNREQGTTIAMVLHDLNLAARFSDSMVAMRDGRIVCCGTPTEVMRAEVLRQTFSIEATIGADPKTGRPACLTYDLLAEGR